jgi:hypothetical protein
MAARLNQIFLESLMANLATKLYATQNNGGSPSVLVSDIVALAGSSFVLPIPTPSLRGGVLVGAGVTASSAVDATAAPAGGTGTAAGGWDTAANRDLAITAINNTRLLALELQTKLNALIASLAANNVIAGG